jgi:hypothetical protein
MYHKRRKREKSYQKGLAIISKTKRNALFVDVFPDYTLGQCFAQILSKPYLWGTEMIWSELLC